MKILIADKFQEDYLGEFEKAGHDVSLQPELSGDDLVAAIKGFEALIVRSTKVTAAVIEESDAHPRPTVTATVAGPPGFCYGERCLASETNRSNRCAGDPFAGR